MIPASFTWEKDGITYQVEGFYAPAEPGESSCFECTVIDPPRELSDADNEELWDHADTVYTRNRQDFFESVMQ